MFAVFELDGLAGLQIDLTDAEFGAVCDYAFAGFREGRLGFGLDVFEIDGLQALFDVQLARFPVQALAAPVVDAVGGIRVLLNFEEQVAGIDSVQATGFEHHGLAGSDDGVGFQGLGFDSFYELLARYAFSQADDQCGIFPGFGHVPALGLGFAA